MVLQPNLNGLRFQSLYIPRKNNTSVSENRTEKLDIRYYNAFSTTRKGKASTTKISNNSQSKESKDTLNYADSYCRISTVGNCKEMEVLKNKNKQLEGLIIALESKLDKSNCLFQDILNKANDYKKFSEEQADLAKSEKEENKKMKVKIEEMDKSIKEYVDEIEKEKDSKEKYKKEIDLMTMEMERVRTKSKKENDDMNRELNRMKKTIKEMNEEDIENKRKIEEMRNEIEIKNNFMDEMKERDSDNNRIIDELKAEINSMTAMRVEVETKAKEERLYIA